ncbi:hypothetical protein [Geomesophilobacter sediminis]|uniref:DUF2345 domain-containing protein n=1 Tax=Geomesophilobacter sediminis TaxID=2798584 RepID=A0A8J7J1H5_9BACT|nr:hypothetical protein [Geomesophilobacter sediminis]MBJ6724588.1 hypothetical protein [Geomesophilobacter sediminis]
MNETVAGAKAEEVGLARSVLVGGRMTEKVGGDRTLSVGKDFTTEVGGTSTLRARSILFEADDEIVLRSGPATIALKSSGDILISGRTVQCRGAGDVVLKGGRISEN